MSHKITPKKHRKQKRSKVLSKSTDIAIVGMACRFPDANHYNKFWDNLVNSKNSIREITPDRWDTEKYYSPNPNEPGKSTSKWAGLIDHLNTFDASFFNISPREAQTMDPQQRILLEETWHCIEDAGIPIKDLRKGNSSVFVGVMAVDYSQHISAADKSTNAYACLGNYEGILANRISYFFNFRGESKSIDAACASSLVALHDAKKSLLSGKSQYAIAAGVSVICHPWKYISFSKAHMLSPDGQCKTFDASANGYVPGEGVGVLLLETLENAIKNGHHIYAILKGSAVHHSGKTQSITAPRVESERDVIKDALADSKISAESITYLEAHGTGTSLGDPIEVEASSQAFNTNKKQFCSIGSVKTNIGHLEGAAGIAGVIKIILMMQHQQIPKTLNVQTVNPIIDFKRTPFRLADKLSNWELPYGVDKRIAAVSSFGFGGVISHAVIEEYKPSINELKKSNSTLLPFTFSAKNKQSLITLINHWQQFKGDASLEDISYTLTQGRNHFDYRYGVTAKTKEELLKTIKDFSQNSVNIKDNKEFVLDLTHVKEIDNTTWRLLCKNHPIFKRSAKVVLKKSADNNHIAKTYILIQAIKQNVPIAKIKGDGLITAVASGMLDLKSALKFLSNNNTKIVLSRPQVSVESTQLKITIEPYRITQRYWEELMSDITIDHDVRDVLLKKSRLLTLSQFTFKKYLEEWQASLKNFNIDIFSAIERFESLNTKQQILVSIILLVCMTKLNRKWQLPNTLIITNTNLLEILDLVMDGVLSEIELVQLIFDAKQLTNICKNKQWQIDPTKSYPLLKKLNNNVPEIKNVKEWLCITPGPDNLLLTHEMSSVAFDIVNITKTLIDLWLIGANIEWQDWYIKRNTAVLPGYEFERTFYWAEMESLIQPSQLPLHPLIDHNTSTLDKTCFTKRLTGEEFYLNDHRVKNIPIMPAVAYLEMARAAAQYALPGQKIMSLRHIIWSRPVFITDHHQEISLCLFPHASGALFEVTTDNGKSKPTIHIQGKIQQSADEQVYSSTLDIESIRHRCQKVIDAKALYQKYLTKGIQCGPSFQVIDEIASNENELIAKIHLPKHLHNESDHYLLHPSIMDGALETIFEILKQDTSIVYLPFGIDELTIYGRFNQNGYVYAKSVPSTTATGIEKFNIEITDDAGKVLVSIKHFALRTMQPEDMTENAKTYAYHLVWENSPIPNAVVDLTKSLLVIDSEPTLWEKLNVKFPQSKIAHIRAFDINQIPEIIICKFQNNLNTSIFDLFNLIKTIIQKHPSHTIQIICFAQTNSIYIDALSGFAKVVKMESPNILIRIVTSDNCNEDVLLRELTATEMEVRYIGNNRLIKSYIQNTLEKNSNSQLIKKSGVYLITGGLGGLGLEFARYLASNFQAQLILSGRSELKDTQKSYITELERLGATVLYLRTDISDQQAVKDLIKIIRDQFGRLNGIFHAAGIIRDSFILKKTEQEMAQVIAPKINGSLYLDEYTKDEPLDFFVMFSSIVSILGNVGQSDYAYANSFMDNFAQVREEQVNLNKRHGKTIAINWPLWANGGMQINPASKLWLNRTFGIVPLSTQDGINALVNALNLPYSQQLIVSGNKEIIDKSLQKSSQSDYGNKKAAHQKSETTSDNLLLETVMNKVISLVAQILSIPIENINATDDVTKFGMDSISITELANKLSDFYAIELSPTILFEYHTMRSFVDYLIKQYRVQLEGHIKPVNLLSEQSQGQAASSHFVNPHLESFYNSEKSRQNDLDIAIIGIHGLFPKSKNLDEFWSHLQSGVDLISEIPRERWDWHAYYGDPKQDIHKTNIKWGGFIDDPTRFDAAFFNISVAEAELMDPQHRLFLQTAWKAIEDAGYDPGKLPNQQVGVFVGVEFNEYEELLESNTQNPLAYALTGNSHAMIANRVSYLLNLHGPSQSIDTGSSSSLVALHNAITALKRNECKLAIAGGVNLILSPKRFLMLGRLGVLSADGHCKTFDKNANGYARAECVGALILKPLDEALTDGDNIYAVIRGSGVNHGGKAQSLTAPNSTAQADLLEQIYRKSGINPYTLTYFEAHGTGTSLGDPTEIEGIKSAFNKFENITNKYGYCGLGTVKTSMGHAEPAAGIASMIKVILSLQNRILPGNVNFKSINPYIEINKTPFYIVQKTTEWMCIADDQGNDLPRRAGISSFGFGGTNAHVILEEAPATKLINNSFKPYYIITLSAKTDTALKNKLTELHEWLNHADTDALLPQISFTLNTGRGHFDKRYACVVKTIDELRETLSLSISDSTTNNAFMNKDSVKNNYNKIIPEILLKQVRTTNPRTDITEYRDNLILIASLYTEGATIDWNILYPTAQQKIPLPSYPFDEARYWFTKIAKQQHTVSDITPIHEINYFKSTWREAEMNAKQASKKLEEKVILFTNITSGITQATSTHTILVRYGERYKKIDEGNYFINGNHLTDYYLLFSDLQKNSIPIKNIIVSVSYKTTMQNQVIASKLKEIFYQGFYLAKAIIQQKLKNIQLMYLIYGDNIANLFSEAQSSFLKTLQKEHPDIKTKIVILENNNVGEKLLTELNSSENEVYYTSDGKRYIKDYLFVKYTSLNSTTFRTQGVYLITGGAGKIGLIIAKFLAQNYQARLVLIGRSVLNPVQVSHINELKQLGYQVEYFQADITQEIMVKDIISKTVKLFGCINGIIHAAGVIHDALIINKNPEDMERVLDSKINGVLHLDAATKDIPLDLFVLFSSVASIFGNLGQCDYAFANGFMDAYALYRNQLRDQKLRYGKCIAINWPFWLEGGMQIDDTAKEWMTQSLGLVPLRTPDGLNAFVAAVSGVNHQLLVLPGDKQIIMGKLNDKLSNQADANAISTMRDLVTIEHVTQKVISCTHHVTQMSNIKIDEEISHYGLDSISLTELSLELNKSLGIEITPAIFYEHQTLKSLIAYIISKYGSEHLNHSIVSINGEKNVGQSNNLNEAINIIPQVEEAIKDNNSKVEKSSTQEDIAIIGISGIFPGADNLNRFWDNLVNKKDLISEIPETRWNWQAIYGDASVDHKTRAKWGGFVDSMYDFDTKFFNISPAEAELMDPQHRLFLRATWEALEDAGYTKDGLKSNKVGVFVGVTNNDYAEILHDYQLTSAHVATGTTHSVLANRISYIFNLHGPSETIDTACSSSLVALHQAITAINNHDCDVAIIGGVNALLSPSIYFELTQAGMLSDDGRCKTFDKLANGYVRGEGASALLLKPLSKAIADRDIIYGVIKGTAVNHGGHVSSLTVPNPIAQAEVIATAIERSNVPINTITYIETHGTGTSIGDPIEINGLKKAFLDLHIIQNKQDLYKQPYCKLGAVKTNIGHLESAAGMAGLIKILLSLRHKKIPGTVHFKELNPYIDLDNTPFTIAQDTSIWNLLKDSEGKDIPRRAGISSFGFGGTNAHAVIEEGPSIAHSHSLQSNIPVLLTVSAHTDLALKQKLNDLHLWLINGSFHNYSFEDIGYTLNKCRNHFKTRYAFIATSIDDFINQLNNVLKSGVIIPNKTEHPSKSVEDIFKDLEDHPLLSDHYKEGLNDLKTLYMEGEEIDWQRFYQNKLFNKVSLLPTYPFTKESHTPNGRSSLITYNQSALHPLVDANISTIDNNCYVKYLYGNEFYLYDHQINHVPTLPGVCYIEMARAVAELSLNKRVVMGIANLIWAAPIQYDKSPIQVKTRIYTQDTQLFFEITTDRENKEPTLHAQGEIIFAAAKSDNFEHINLHDIKDRLSKKYTGEEIYTRFKILGFDYGPTFQVIQDISSNQREVLAKISVNVNKIQESYILHPSLMDGALQSTLLLVNPDNFDLLYLPFSIGQIEIHEKLSSTCYVHAILNETGDTDIKKIQLTITNEDGKILVKIRDFTARLLVSKKQKSSVSYFKPNWEVVPVPSVVNEPILGSILVLEINNEISNFLIDNLPNNPIIQVRPADHYKRLDKNKYQINTHEKLSFKQLFEDLEIQNLIPRYIVCKPILTASEQLSEEELMNNVQDSIHTFLLLIQSFLKLKFKGVIKIIWLDYNGSHLTKAIYGFSRTLYIENPNIIFRIVQFNSEKQLKSHLIQELVLNETLVNYGANDVRSILQYKEITLPGIKHDIAFKNQGAYIISGGLGGLGMIFSRYLAKHFQARLILLGRSQLHSKQFDLILELEANGAKVEYFQVDITKEKDLTNIYKIIKTKYKTINGVIHSAGILHDSYILNKTFQETTTVIAPKVIGTVHLDRITQNEPLDFFIMFSSLAANIGNIGQADYAFANGFMNEYAHTRERLRLQKKRHGITLAINWPLWESGGMQVDDVTLQSMASSFGATPLSTTNGIQALFDAIELGEKECIIISGDKQKLETILNMQPQSSVGSIPKEKNEKDVISQSDIHHHIMNYLKQILATTIKIPIDQLQPNDSFEQVGIDSLLIISLNRTLEKTFTNLPKTLFFEYKDLNELATYFMENHSEEVRSKLIKNVPQDQPEKNELKSNLPDSSSKNVLAKMDPPSKILNKEKEDIAIIGISGRYPQANNLAQFWENLKLGRDSISEIPIERWDYKKYYDPDKSKPGKVYSKWGGFIDDIDKFDPLFFNISPRDAETIDPQERLFLETAWQAIEDAGYSKEKISGKMVGVYVGIMYEEYQLYGTEETLKGNTTSVGWTPASTANRVSYFFDFRGPSISLDTMCSSSLSAIYLACESIHNGRCQMALAGGVNVSIHPNKYIALAQGKFLASDGRCKSFGEGGDGYVPGEGVGAVLLKPLSQALADGDHIYGVIKGAYINHGGKTNGYTVPNPIAQAELIKAGIKESGIDPSTISYIEAHGTGTSLGDPIEMNGLVRAFEGKLMETCAVGSVKSNIGHLESAAGMAALTKVLLQMQHGMLVPSLYSSVLNPNISWENIPFKVQQKLQPWNSKSYPRRAIISSFGAGGANGMLVIEEAPPIDISIEKNNTCYIAPLSAKTEEALKQKIIDLEYWLGHEDLNKITLNDICYTLSVGRTHFEKKRCAIVVSSLDELRTTLLKLKMNLKTGNAFFSQPSDNRYQAIFKQTLKHVMDDVARDDLSQEEYRDKLLSLANLYAEGYLLDWERLYQKNLRRKISLPTYPLAKEHYWVPNFQKYTQPVNRQSTLHPLLDLNTSTLKGQSFQKTLNGDEFYLMDHQVKNIPTLPGVAYIEMARAAGELAMPEQTVTSLRNIIWAKPIQLDKLAMNVIIKLSHESNGALFEVLTTNQSGDKIPHASGKIIYQSEQYINSDRIDINALKKRCHNEIDIEEFYNNFKKIGLNYGNTFRTLQTLNCNETECIAQLSSINLVYNKDFVLHPAIMDGALQTTASIINQLQSTTELYLPFSIGEVTIYEKLPDICFVYTMLVPGSVKAGLPKFHIQIMDEGGNVLVRITDFSIRAIQTKNVKHDHEIYYYHPVLVQKDIYQSKSPIGSILLIDEDDELFNIINSKNISGSIRLVKRGNPLDYYSTLLKDLDSDPPEIIIYHAHAFTNMSPDNLKDQLKSHMYSLFNFSQALIKHKQKHKMQLICITGSSFFTNSFSGFCKTLHIEQPNLECHTIEIGNNRSNVIDILKKELTSKDKTTYYNENMERSVKHYVQTVITDRQHTLLKKEGVYIITGGMGGLGMLFARKLAQKYFAKLILTGRSALNPQHTEAIKSLKQMGADAIYVQADVGDPNDVEKLISLAKSTYGQIHGVIHSAGVLRDAFIMKKTPEQIEEVIDPKITGTVYLDFFTKEQSLDFFVLFSSVAAVTGNIGQCDYSYSNGFMDTFAEYREELRLKNQRHGKTISINWPLWANGGMHIDATAERIMKETLGLTPLDIEAGYNAFEIALALNSSQIMILCGDKTKFEHALRIGSVDTNVIVNEKISSVPTALIQENLQSKTEEYLMTILANTLKISVDKLNPSETFDQYGIDSVVIMTLNQTLEKTFGDLPKTLFFEYPDLKSLTNYFIDNKADVLSLLFFGPQPKQIEKPITNTKMMNIEPQTHNALPSEKDTSTNIATISNSTHLVEIMEDYLKLLLSTSIKLPSEKINVNESFEEFGIDSVVIMSLNQALEKDFGDLPKTLFFEYTNLKTLAAYFADYHMDRVQKLAGLTNKKADTQESVKENKIIENYKKSFINYNQVSLTIVPTSYSINIEVAEAGTGDVILLLSPWGCVSTAWRYQFEELAKHYRVISVHYPGCGRSEFKENLIEFDLLSDLILDVLNKLGINSRIHLVGWSVGGIVAQYYLAKNPNKIKSLTLVNSTSYMNTDERNYKNVEEIMRPFKEDFNLSKQETHNSLMLDQINGINDKKIQKQYFTKGIIFNTNDLKIQFSLPTLMIAGERDFIMPIKDFILLKDQIKNAEWHVLSSAGHYIPLFYYKFFNEKIISFLNNISNDPLR